MILVFNASPLIVLTKAKILDNVISQEDTIVVQDAGLFITKEYIDLIRQAANE